MASTRFGPIQCRERLGGVLNFYCRDAAKTRGSSCRTPRDRVQLPTLLASTL